MEYILVTTMVVALTEAVKAASDRNWRTVVVIVGSALIGAGCGLLGIEGLDVVQGIVVGLGASGVVTVAKKI
jgi:hypothetical protein